MALARPPRVGLGRGESSGHGAEVEATTLGRAIGSELTSAIEPGPIDGRVRTVAEAHLGVDLGGVHLDASPRAGAEVRREGASAVTEGDRVAFAPGYFDPSSRGGRALIGHELVHVAQQRTHGLAVAQRGEPEDAPRGPYTAEQKLNDTQTLFSLSDRGHRVDQFQPLVTAPTPGPESLWALSDRLAEYADGMRMVDTICDRNIFDSESPGCRAPLNRRYRLVMSATADNAEDARALVQPIDGYHDPTGDSEMVGVYDRLEGQRGGFWTIDAIESGRLVATHRDGRVETLRSADAVEPSTVVRALADMQPAPGKTIVGEGETGWGPAGARRSATITDENGSARITVAFADGETVTYTREKLTGRAAPPGGWIWRPDKAGAAPLVRSDMHSRLNYRPGVGE